MADIAAAACAPQPKQRLALWGAGGHALVLADIVRAQGQFELVGFIDDVHPERRGTRFGAAKILGGREQLDSLREWGVEWVIIAVGNCAARSALADLARRRGFRLATAVHPRAVVASDVRLGGGTVVAAGAVVNPGTRIGANVIVNTSASVDHECTIEDAVHIGPGARLGGRVTVRHGSWIGIGATVRDRRVIGRQSIVGAGAVVVDDVPDGVVTYGVPARVKRAVEENEA
jgi:UDP-N-acetylbacillosamine N-acetyltransferase